VVSLRRGCSAFAVLLRWFSPICTLGALAQMLLPDCRCQSPVTLKRVEYSGRIKAWASANEHDHLFQLGGAKLRRNFFDAALVEQQGGRDDVFGNGHSDSPSDCIRMKIDSKTVRHGAGIYFSRGLGAAPSEATNWTIKPVA
jgi:hypothetical protein